MHQQELVGGAHPLVKADDGPQAAAYCTAAAQAAAEKPLHIHRQVLLQAGVHPPDARLELLRRNLKQNKNKRGFVVVSAHLI